jgi:transcription-repair coupling factor (superfamily II helicase)
VSLRLDFVATREAEALALGGAAAAKIAPAILPLAYISESQTRIQAYRRLSEITSQEELEALCKAWRDRFGPLPHAVVNLLLLSEIKIAAGARKIAVVEVREQKAMFTRGGDYILLGGKFPRLHEKAPDQRLRELAALIRSL